MTTGNQVAGKAEKTSYSVQHVFGAEKSQLEISASLKDGLLEATFDEVERLRTSNGKFVWRFSDDYRSFEGAFESTAAKTRGHSSGYKLPE